MLKTAPGTLSVVSTRDTKAGHYIGRPMNGGCGSALANPFKANSKTTEEHDRVVALYRTWLWAQIKARKGPVCNELQSLLHRCRAGENLMLRCWCKPLPCHGDVLKACLEWAIKTDYTFVPYADDF